MRTRIRNLFKRQTATDERRNKGELVRKWEINAAVIRGRASQTKVFWPQLNEIIILLALGSPREGEGRRCAGSGAKVPGA